MHSEEGSARPTGRQALLEKAAPSLAPQSAVVGIGGGGWGAALFMREAHASVMMIITYLSVIRTCHTKAEGIKFGKVRTFLTLDDFKTFILDFTTAKDPCTDTRSSQIGNSKVHSNLNWRGKANIIFQITAILQKKGTPTQKYM